MDRLVGESGADRLFGHFGDDLLDGGSDNDVLNGGVGNDQLTGGTGGDRFQHLFIDYNDDYFDGGAAGEDTIIDFRQGSDVIQIGVAFSASIIDDPPPMPVWNLDFGDLDSNGNGVLDDDDRFVEIEDSGSQHSTVLQTSEMLAAINEGDPVSWDTSSLTIQGVTGLQRADFAFGIEA